MSYPKKLVRLQPIGGLVHDVPASEVGPGHYTGAHNVRFPVGFAERIKGERAAYDPPSVAPLGLINTIVGGINYWVYVGDNKQHVVTVATHSDITLAAGLQSAPRGYLHSLSSLNGVVVHNNSRDAPMYWPGVTASPFIALPGWPAGSVAARLVAHKFHLFALNMDETAGLFPMKLIWSDAAEPGTVPSTWAPAADNQAGDVELSDSPGALIDAATLRDTLLIYKRGAIYAGDYVRGNNIYEFRPVFKGVGALCPGAIAVTERGHVFVSDGDILFTDGNQVQSIADARVRRFLFDQINQDRYEDLFCVYHRAVQEILVCFPVTGADNATLALVYNMNSDAWGVRELSGVAAAATGIVNDTAVSEAWDDDAASWDSDLTIWNQQSFMTDERMLVAEPGNTKITMLDTTDAVAREASISKHDMTFGEAERLKFLKRLHLRADGNSGTLLVRAGSRMSLGDAIGWGAEVTVPPGQQVVNLRALGRYISVEVRSTGEHVWRIPGFDLEVELRGYH